MSADADPGAPSVRRPRRERGIREILLSVVLGLEAAVMFFATLAVNGLTELPAGAVLAGGAVFILILIAVAALQRFGWAVVVGGILQGAIIATGVLTPFMYVIGAGFAAFWVWCLVRARRIEEARRGAAPEGENA